MLAFNGNTAMATFGPGRSRVPYYVSKAYLLGPLAEAGLDEPTVIHGGVMTSDGGIHDLRDVPEGSTIDRSLWIRARVNCCPGYLTGLRSTGPLPQSLHHSYAEGPEGHWGTAVSSAAPA